MLTALAIASWVLIVALVLASHRRLEADALRPCDPQDGRAPISVIAAVRNEAPRIAEMIRWLLAQDHPDFEVVIVDDRSTDRTAEIVRRAVASDPRIRILQADPPPPGWQGRLYAQGLGVRASTRDWLLFLSADQRLAERSLLRAVVARCMSDPTGAIAVVGRFTGCRWWDRWWFQPVINNPVVVGTILLMQRVFPRSVWLVGALAMARTTYEHLGGSEAARSCGGGLFEDLGWARAFAASGRPARTLFFPRLEDVSNWEGPRHLVQGVTRWIAGVFTYRRRGWVLGAFLIVALVAILGASTVVGLHLVSGGVPPVAALPLAAIPLTLGVSYCLRDDRSLWVAPWLYVVAIFALIVLVNGAIARFRNRVVWRGDSLRLLG